MGLSEALWQFPPDEVHEYWLSQCRPVADAGVARASLNSDAMPPETFRSGLAPSRYQTNHSVHDVIPKASGGGPRKRDPDNGKFYTYEELQKKYAGSKTELKLRQYWNFDCTGL